MRQQDIDMAKRVLDLYPVAGVRPSLHVRLPIGDPYDATWKKP